MNSTLTLIRFPWPEASEMEEYYCVGDGYVREYVEQFIDAWMMIDCGVEESWTRRYTIGPFQCAYPVFNVQTTS